MQVEVRKTSETSCFDVAIVGLGPVGAVLANLLGLAGVRTVVIERETNIHDLPRAVHFDDEVMRVFQTIGVADAVENISRVNPGMRFVDAQGNMVLDWSRPQQPGPMGWHPSYRFHQPDLERILRAALLHHRSVTVCMGAEVTALDETRDGAVLTINEVADARMRTIEASFVVGCDGARSLVRKYVTDETDAEDLGFHENWLVVDLRLTRDRPDLGDYTIQHCDPGQPVTYVRGPGERRRWEIALSGTEPPEDILRPEAIWSRLKRWITPEDAGIERAAVYTFHSVIAGNWRRGPFLIAGDAAHQMPPFMGQGMCAGIRDVANLGWKLARCVAGKSAEQLLDSYQFERHAHVRAYTQAAVQLGKLVSGGVAESGWLDNLPRPEGTAEMKSPTYRLGPGLGFGNDAHVGQLFPQPVLAGGIPLDHLTGYGAALVVRTSVARDLSDLEQQTQEADVRYIEAQSGSPLCAVLNDLECDAALVRADRYIFGMVKTATYIDLLLAEWTRQSMSLA